MRISDSLGILTDPLVLPENVTMGIIKPVVLG